MALSDDFNRAALGANWQTLSGGTGGVPTMDSSTAVKGANPDYNGCWWTANAWNDTQTSYVVTNPSSANYKGPAVRMNGTAQASSSFYCYFSHGEIQRVVNGFNTTVAGGLGVFGNGDNAEIRASGTSISAYRNGVLQGSATDAGIASGSAGIGFYGGGGPITDWQGTGEVTGGATVGGPVFAGRALHSLAFGRVLQ
jgi:hypothetical protein